MFIQGIYKFIYTAQIFISDQNILADGFFVNKGCIEGDKAINIRQEMNEQTMRLIIQMYVIVIVMSDDKWWVER